MRPQKEIVNKKINRTNSDSILEALTVARAPMTPNDLADRLGLGGDDHEAFNREVEELERSGRIVRNRAGLLLVAARANLLSGQVQGHRDGFGFLIRDDAGADLVLSEHEMAKVLHGDRVLARITGADRRGRPEGEIVEVIESRTNKLVGRLLNERGVTIVVPEDQRIAHDILVPPGASLSAEPGQVVVVEILQQPQRYVQPVGRVIEVLGAIDDPGMEIEIAVRKFAVPHEFSDATAQLAESLPDTVLPKDLRGRIDLRDVPLVTIDGEDARDFDDAVYCEPVVQGGRRKGWRLIVAVADVSHYVKPGDLLDIEAQNRSTSVYFPRRVIPMLPEKLSNGLCSLKPEVDRLVMVCDCVVTNKGALDAYQFYPAVMHSHARLTYTEVWEALSAPDSKEAQRLASVLPHLQNLYSLYELLKRARDARGAIDLDTTETYIVCDANGRIEKIIPRTRNDAHKLIEECMLAANVCTADFIGRGKQPGLYRVHEGPTPERLANVRTLLKTLGLTLDGGRQAGARRLRTPVEADQAAPRCTAVANRDAAFDAAGDLQPAQLGPLWPCLQGLHALHLTDPALSGLAGASCDQGDAGEANVRAGSFHQRGRRCCPRSRASGIAGVTEPQAGRRERSDTAVGKTGIAVFGQRAPRRRCIARCGSVAEELLHARAGGGDVYRHRQLGRAVRGLHRARRFVHRGFSACLRARHRVLPLQRSTA